MGSFFSSQMKCVIACIAAASALTQAQKEYLQGQSDAQFHVIQEPAYNFDKFAYEKVGLTESAARRNPDGLAMSVLRTGVEGPGMTKEWAYGVGCNQRRLLNDNDPS